MPTHKPLPKSDSTKSDSTGPKSTDCHSIEAYSIEPYSIELCRAHDGSWARAEEELVAAGVPLPLVQRSAWSQALGQPQFLLCARAALGRAVAALPVTVTRTRALPGHCVWRAERIGAAAELAGLVAAMAHFKELAAAEPRVLCTELALFSLDGERLRELSRAASLLGFSPEASPRGYAETAVVDLTGSEAEVLGRFHGTARRHIRAFERRGLTLAPITHPDRAAEMQALVEETRRRTGGAAPRRPFADTIALANLRPDLVRVVGVHDADDGRLLAFACGHRNGDHVSYADAASTRAVRSGTPLGYGPAWALMHWARSLGATTLDFGGITAGSYGDAADAVGGISEFKRYFRGAVVTVGSEWRFEPRPLRAALAAGVRKLIGAS